MKKVFIDGSAGTTGLRIKDRLGSRADIELITLPEEERKLASARKAAINSADIVFLCLPDDAAREAVAMCENPNTVILDTSTAHRTDPRFAYGFPELSAEHKEKIINSKRIAVPGCHASGFIALVYPLIKAGIIDKGELLTCMSLTGYSGGGKKMIADYEGEGKTFEMNSPCPYAMGQGHKHLPEMQKICGLDAKPVFTPIVDDYYKGMSTTVSFHMSWLKGVSTLEEVRQKIADHYAGAVMVQVAPTTDAAKVYGNAKAGQDTLTIVVAGNDEQFTVTALFDNLGKGASGAAVQNMNIMLGLDETTGLSL